MQNKYIFAVFVIAAVVLFVSGTLLSDQKIDINGCKASWKLLSVNVPHSDVCPSQFCVASSATQQHNAIVDALLCACSSAKSSQYSDADANKRIQDVVNNYFGYSLGASDICEQSGLFLTKISYG